jgi:hypothetical protein
MSADDDLIDRLTAFAVLTSWPSDAKAMAAAAKRLAELAAELLVAKNRLGNAVGAIVDSGGYCEGPHDVADAIYRLTAERDGLKEMK